MTNQTSEPQTPPSKQQIELSAQTASPALPSAKSPVRTLGLTALAMAAFASNSILCRKGLGAGAIDPASYTAIRLASGAVVLSIVYAAARSRAPVGDRPDSKPAGTAVAFAAAAALLLYAIAFSYAYIGLKSGTGALILFGSVQATMIIAGLIGGERPNVLAWMGFVAAAGGLVYLVSPGLAAPPLLGAALMAVAGVSWGVYSLLGRGGGDPVARTWVNFVRTAPVAVFIAAAAFSGAHLTAPGIWLASLSGGISSGLGYVVWFAALKGLTATRAALVQLSVPVLVAISGVAFLGEQVSGRLVVSSILVLGGIALAIGADVWGKAKKN